MKKQTSIIIGLSLVLALILFAKFNTYAGKKGCRKPKRSNPLLGTWIQIGAKPTTTWKFKKNGKVTIKGLSTMTVPWSLKKNKLKIHVGSNPIYTLTIKGNKMTWSWKHTPIKFIRKK